MLRAPLAPAAVLVATACASACAAGQGGGGAAVSPGPTGWMGDTACLNADGPGGRDAYDLIEGLLGVGSIEHPDGDHVPPQRHITEDQDDVVGPHFVFALHRDTDRDRGRADVTDRQRLEIKVFDRSPERLQAREHAAFTYVWWFKLPPALAVSRKFTHLFQLKGVGGDDKMPLVTLTAVRHPVGDRLEVRHMLGQAAGGDFEVLMDTDLAAARGRWVQAICRARFAERGSLHLRLARDDGTVLMDVARDGIDLWRSGDFVRPKWGIYRSLDDAAALNAEDEVRFAGFGITPGPLPGASCQAARPSRAVK